MPIESQTFDHGRTVFVRGALSIWEAADTWRTLLPLLSSPDPMTVDLSEVESCDGAGLQIICQIVRAAGLPDAAITLGPPSPPVTAALVRAGLVLEPFANTAQET